MDCDFTWGARRRADVDWVVAACLLRGQDVASQQGCSVVAVLLRCRDLYQSHLFLAYHGLVVLAYHGLGVKLAALREQGGSPANPGLGRPAAGLLVGASAPAPALAPAADPEARLRAAARSPGSSSGR